MTTFPKTSVLSRISSLLEEINSADTEKQATEMGLSGDGKKDPGGYQGASSHPSARPASNVQSAPLGARAKENESDVKKEHPGSGVDHVKPGSGGTQDDKQINVGTHQSSTGEDPKVEDDYKGDKDDKREGDRGGTSGPFNAERVGEKYSSMQFNDLCKAAYDRMNSLIADIGAGILVKDEPKPETKTASTQVSEQSKEAKEAVAAGYELADIAARQGEFDKKAYAKYVFENVIRDACLNANLVGDFLTKYAQDCESLAYSKQSNDGAMGGAMDGGGGPAMPPVPPEAGPGGPPPGAGGPGGPGGEGGMQEAQVDEIISALLESGATPEEIMQALQADAGGAAGGAPPGAGGPPPGGMPPAEGPGGPPPGGMPPGMGGGEPKMGSDNSLKEDKKLLFKLAAAASDKWRSGNWTYRPVKPGSKEAQERKLLQDYIVEVVRA